MEKNTSNCKKGQKYKKSKFYDIIDKKEKEKMSKYQPLWNYIKTLSEFPYTMSFKEIHDILGFSIDHSFLNAKKELISYGYIITKISLKNKTIQIESVS